MSDKKTKKKQLKLSQIASDLNELAGEFPEKHEDHRVGLALEMVQRAGGLIADVDSDQKSKA